MWPFDQPRDCVTLTTTHVVRNGAPITHAYHDEDDHGWQFYSEHETRTQDAMVVALREIVEIDPRITEVADLTPGWMARREGPGMPWIRKLQYDDACRVIVDWSEISSEDDFYDLVLPQCGGPAWHGRNLDALNDSWVTGGIDRGGPPYAFGFLSLELTEPELIRFRDMVLEIARDSINENGGRYLHIDELGSWNPDQLSR